MSNDQLKFWITCPTCKTPFGVEPRAIPQYLNRVLGTLTCLPDRQAAETTEAGSEMPPENAGEASALPVGRHGEPTPPPAKPPYRKYPKSGYGKPWQKR